MGTEFLTEPEKNTTQTKMKQTILSVLMLILSMSLLAQTTPKILIDFQKNPKQSILPDFSYAGYAYGNKAIPEVKTKTFLVTDFGAIPNDGKDDTKSIQNAVNAAGKNGGIVLFPAGRFHINMNPDNLGIIRINHSNVVLRGSGSGKDGTIIFSGSSTHQREENSPWLSPFVFHTGLNLHGTDYFYSVREEPVFATIISAADTSLQSTFPVSRTPCSSSISILFSASKSSALTV